MPMSVIAVSWRRNGLEMPTELQIETGYHHDLDPRSPAFDWRNDSPDIVVVVDGGQLGAERIWA